MRLLTMPACCDGKVCFFLLQAEQTIVDPKTGRVLVVLPDTTTNKEHGDNVARYGEVISCGKPSTNQGEPYEHTGWPLKPGTLIVFKNMTVHAKLILPDGRIPCYVNAEQVLDWYLPGEWEMTPKER